MEISANFAFLMQEFPHAAESASYAEHHVYDDPRASCFHARHALERLVKRVYRVEKTLSPPKVTNLDAYLGNPAFQRARARGRVAEGGVRPAGGQRRGARQQDAGAGARAERGAGAGARPLLGGPHLSAEGGGEPSGEDVRRDPRPHSEKPDAAPSSVAELGALKRSLDAAEDARKEVEGELEAVREELAAVKAENEAVPETHDWNEGTTRRLIIDLALAAGRLAARSGARP